MGEHISDFGGRHTTLWCDHKDCEAQIQIPGGTSIYNELPKLINEGWDQVDNRRLYCPKHLAVGVQAFRDDVLKYRLAEAEKEAHAVLKKAALAGKIHEEAKHYAATLLDDARHVAECQIKEEETTRSKRRAKYARQKAAEAAATTALEELKRK